MGIQLRRCAEIFDALKRLADKVDRPEYSRQPPHVLIFEVAAVAPAQHHCLQCVVAWCNALCQIKLGRQSAVLRVADKFAVAPQIKSAVYAVEAHPHLFVEPVIGQLEVARVAAGRVVVGHPWRFARKRVFNIGVDRIVVTLQLPV